MGKWAQRLAELEGDEFSREAPRTTDRTDETPAEAAADAVVSVLSVPEGGTSEKSTVAADDATARLYRLTREQGDRCHAPCWDDAEIAIFSARVRVLMRRGIGTDDADDLAERLTLRDREGDDQRICIECSQLSDKGRCIAAATGRLAGADTRLEPVQTILHGCDAFELRKGLA